ncbi:MAG TPA: TIM barrel protein [Candidatus Hydrogenedentes bacterium]|nr:TIM barrel protein [Candidatus Hydrogenedentota bacterium]HRZ82328.1 TIM barrel protein [Candidatus Hydrogenedentota bacterium]
MEKGTVNGLSRRGFLAGAAGGALAAGLMARRAAAADGGMVRLGAPVPLEGDDPAAWAKAHRALGYRAAYCPDIPLKDTDRLRAVEKAFAAEDVVLAEVGRWCNLMDADPEARKKNLERVTEGLALAEAVGARCCVDIAGSFNKESWFGPHPDNLSPAFFDAAVENARKIIDAVKPSRAKFAYEMMGWALPDSADSYLALIKAVDRPGFGVHLDPCNAVNSPARYYGNTALLNECFDKLGAWIASCHAKDLTWDVEMNIHFREVVPGTGTLDYATFLRRLAALPGQPPLMIEHLASQEEYLAGAKHIFGVGAGIGVRFE